MLGTANAQKKTTPNPFRLEEFAVDGRSIVVKKKTDKEAKMEVLTNLSKFTSKFGPFLSSGKSETDPQYAINVKKEITGPVGKSPIAYLTVRHPGDEKGTTLCNLFRQTYPDGSVYLKGSNRETGEIYYVYANEARAAGAAS
jgi:hypothetical protein